MRWSSAAVKASSALVRCCERRSAKGLRSLFFDFETLSVTFWSLFLMLLSLFSSSFCQTPFCRTPFVAGWPKSTAKLKSEFGSFAAKIHTARIWPWDVFFLGEVAANRHRWKYIYYGGSKTLIFFSAIAFWVRKGPAGRVLNYIIKYATDSFSVTH